MKSAGVSYIWIDDPCIPWPRHAALALALALAMTGCGKGNVRPQPVEEGCEALCRTPCDASVPEWKPADPTDPKAWDTYPEQVTIPLRGKVEQCEIHRTSCVQCLDRLKAAGVTR